MKTLYESILDVDKDYDNDLLISMLFNKDIQLRREAFSTLLKMIESHRPKQHMSTAKMKNSDSFFIQFSKSYEIKDKEATATLMPYFSYIYICKQTGPYGYRTTFINASDEHFGRNIDDYVERWQYTRSNFTPQSKACVLYEVPEELNELFKQIQIEASNHKIKNI